MGPIKGHRGLQGLEERSRQRRAGVWELKALLSPGHGFWSEAQSQMRLEIKVSHRVRGQQGEGQIGEPSEGEGGRAGADGGTGAHGELG